jgi:hypothetical protein
VNPSTEALWRRLSGVALKEALPNQGLFHSGRFFIQGIDSKLFPFFRFVNTNLPESKYCNAIWNYFRGAVSILIANKNR